VWNYINTPLGRINFFNTHLSFNSANVRVLQVQQIIPYIENIESVNPGIATILTGDFNDRPTAFSIRLLTETGTDTFYISTFADVNPGDLGYTMPSNAPNAKIDYVFFLKIPGAWRLTLLLLLWTNLTVAIISVQII
jgi:endonuclease/exonuclease/phosphatase family metal-dependent hydrolase